MQEIFQDIFRRFDFHSSSRISRNQARNNFEFCFLFTNSEEAGERAHKPIARAPPIAHNYA